jgi:hypothetical protein
MNPRGDTPPIIICGVKSISSAFPLFSHQGTAILLLWLIKIHHAPAARLDGSDLFSRTKTDELVKSPYFTTRRRGRREEFFIIKLLPPRSLRLGGEFQFLRVH